MTSDSELRARLAAACYGNSHQYKPLAEWLGVYEYILPDARKLWPRVWEFKSSREAYVFWEFCYLIECCLTDDEQVMTWTLISESLISRIPLSSRFIVARESSNSIG